MSKESTDSLGNTDRPIYRYHYRGQLKPGSLASIDQVTPAPSTASSYHCREAVFDALQECVSQIESLIVHNQLMTVALYYYGDMLFLYYEAIGTEFTPNEFMAPLSDFLLEFPGQDKPRLWAQMYSVFYHAIPEGEKDWKRITPPSLRRGRIAFLVHENMFEYVFHHVAIVKEGLLAGDKYQSIALHEDILFSYFEEPKHITNIRRVEGTPSEAIKDWLAVDPESHFVQMPKAEGLNFLFLPAFFTLGQ